MKKVIERIVRGDSTHGIPYTCELVLECGHSIVKGGPMNGGYTSYRSAKHQKKAKCKECEK